jgi:hypothetical protein
MKFSRHLRHNKASSLRPLASAMQSSSNNEMRGMNGHEVASEIRLTRPEIVVILLSRREVPMQALALVDAFVPKLEASQQLLPIIAELCSRSQKAKRRQESV